MRKTDRHTFFFTDRDCFSNWYPSPFQVAGVQFGCVEQFMMYQKAVFFNDPNTAAKILSTSSPKEQKALGRLVQNFDAEKWEEVGEKLVYVGLLEKYRQNSNLLEKMMETGDTLFVEASPFDRIWGIGMRETDVGVDDEFNWKGKNKLGKLTTRAREELKLEVSYKAKVSKF